MCMNEYDSSNIRHSLSIQQIYAHRAQGAIGVRRNICVVHTTHVIITRSLTYTTHMLIQYHLYEQRMCLSHANCTNNLQKPGICAINNNKKIYGHEKYTYKDLGH